MGTDNLVSQVLRGDLFDMLDKDNIMADALRDLLRDEVKGRMREELNANPELRSELKDAVRMYYEAKIREAYATLKFAKASAKLGLELMPPNLREELGKEVAGLVEREVSQILGKSL